MTDSQRRPYRRRSEVLGYITENPRCDKEEIARALGMTQTAVTRAALRLEADGLVRNRTKTGGKHRAHYQAVTDASGVTSGRAVGLDSPGAGT